MENESPSTTTKLQVGPRELALAGAAALLAPGVSDDPKNEPLSAAEKQALHAEIAKLNLRNHSLRGFLKRKRTSQPHGKCACGKVISGNKTQCGACANAAPQTD